MVWAKFAIYRWWPSVIVSESMVPRVLLNAQKHVRERGDFCCKFLGTNDHAWLPRRRVFLYHEDDAKLPLSGALEARATKSRNSEAAFSRSLIEARLLNEIMKTRRESRQSALAKVMCPLPYLTLKKNRVVPPVKLDTVDVVALPKCTCDPESGCGNACLNRQLYIECHPAQCPAGVQCENQRFQRRCYPPLALLRCPVGKGWGLCAKRDLKEGEFVIEYVGELITVAEMTKRIRLKEETKHDEYYFLELVNNVIIDAERKGNYSRFINHSCDPNCETQKWSVNGHDRVGIFAKQDIAAVSWTCYYIDTNYSYVIC